VAPNHDTCRTAVSERQPETIVCEILITELASAGLGFLDLAPKFLDKICEVVIVSFNLRQSLSIFEGGNKVSGIAAEGDERQ
jgi:hypothetical protein